MDKESTNKLRLDTRLLKRRGWIEDAELQSELESLPDVSSKVADGTEEPVAPAESAPSTVGAALGIPEPGTPEAGGA